MNNKDDNVVCFDSCVCLCFPCILMIGFIQSSCKHICLLLCCIKPENNLSKINITNEAD